MPCSHRVPSKRKHRRFIPGICATIEAWEQWLRAASINQLLYRPDRGIRFHPIEYDVFPASSSSVTHAGDCSRSVSQKKQHTQPDADVSRSDRTVLAAIVGAAMRSSERPDRAPIARDVPVLPPAQLDRIEFRRRGVPPHGGLPLWDRDDALVVVEEGEVRPGITAQAWFAMIEVRT